jgi:aprataxin
MPPNLFALRQYATKSDPGSLPPSVLFQHTSATMTIFDAYPKSKFHFLVLPRVRSSEDGLTVSDLSNLKQLLKHDKEQAKAVVTGLAEEARRLRSTIEAEMVGVGGQNQQAMPHLSE